MDRRRGAAALDTLVVLAATAVLLGGFTTLFDGGRWAVVVLSVLVPVAVVLVLVRAIAPFWATPAGLVAGAAMIVWVFAPGSTDRGVPTARSLDALAGQLDRARTVIVEEVAPIAPPMALTLVVAIAFALVFVLADAVARQSWRVPLLGLLWIALLVVPSIISMQMPPWWVVAGAATAWLWLWWDETPHGDLVPRGATALTIVAAVGAALALPLVAPAIKPTSRDFGVVDSEVFGRGINPMIELGRSLRQPDARRVLTYTSDEGEGRYLKVATLRQFSRRTWTPSPVLGDLDAEGLAEIDDDVAAEDVTTSIRIENLRSTYLPVPYPATRIRGLAGDWQWQRDGSTVRAEGPTTTEGQTYTVTSVDRRPMADQLRAVSRAGRSLDAYRALPSDVPAIVTDLAAERSEGATTDYDRMLAIQNWLRSDFTYSVEAPVEEGYDGNGLDVMGEFLRREQGYCVHFASTLAVMGRVLDIPTRVAVGYSPGDSVLRRSPGTVTYGVDSDDLHAWTEAYFDGIGWIGFDATPGVGSATRFEEEVDGGRAGASDSEVPEATEQDSSDSLDRADDAGAVEVGAQEVSSWRPVLTALAVVVLVSAVPGAIRWLRRRRRWRVGRTSNEALWTEVADTARDLGMDLDPAETPRVFGRRLRAQGAEAGPLQVLVADVERDRYAEDTTVPRVAEARRVVRSLTAASGRRARWLARILPRSLVR